MIQIGFQHINGREWRFSLSVSLIIWGRYLSMFVCYFNLSLVDMVFVAYFSVKKNVKEGL